MCPKWMDGPDQISGLRQVRSQKVLTSMSRGARISEMDDRATHVLPQIDGYNSFTVSGLIVSRPLDLETSDILNADISMHQ
jgi:hypothetical protein